MATPTVQTLEECRRFIEGAESKVLGATEIVGFPGVSERAADGAFGMAGDAINLATKAVLRFQGIDLRRGDENGPAMLTMALGYLRQVRVVGANIDDDALTSIIRKRNGSVHDGVAAIQTVEHSKRAIGRAAAYVATCRAGFSVWLKSH